MTAAAAPLRPPMPYAGGKQTLAARIADLLPAHRHYVEPFAGGLSVLLAKQPSPIETVNDLHGDLITFWRVLRDRTDDLARVCALTPHSRAELQAASTDHADLDEVERARRVWVQLTQGRGARIGVRTGWRFVQGGNQLSLPDYLNGYLERLGPVADRLRRVSLECRDALELIAAYGQRHDTCLYVDPPYLGETRHGQQYAHELITVRDHQRLLETLVEVPAAVVLSGYAHPLYEEALAGWQRHEFAATAMTGDARTEVVWINRAHQGHLFSEDPS